MGFLMFAGLIGTIGYMTHYAKQETKAIIGDSVLQPTHNIRKDKQIIEDNFELICKRCDIKLNKNNQPIYEKRYRPCVAYLQYQGFSTSVTDYFQQLYLERYNNKHETKIIDITEKHNRLLDTHFDTFNQRTTKVVRYWHYGNTKEKCKKMMTNTLWAELVYDYNIVKDGSQNVEVWIIKTSPEILQQIDTIYDEVCHMTGIYKNEK